MWHWLEKILAGGDARDDAGAAGERVAANWLRRERGFMIVARNWRSPRDRREEIDLVCRDGDVLVFIEVKARAAGALVPGYHAVNARKKRVLRRAIDAYLAQLREKPRTFRFDVVEVSAAAEDSAAGGGTATGAAVLHFTNVPLFSKHFRA
jgi:putative endonuclease